MPIYEYKCSKCGKKFEKLIIGVHKSERIRCGACGSSDVQRLMSQFSASSASARSAGETGSSCAPRSSGFS